MTEQEIWKSIAGFADYEVSNHGRFRRIGKSSCLVAEPDADGYRTVRLHKRGRRFHFRAARIVAAAFVENPHRLPEINHDDSCRSNDRASNLSWTSRSGNMRHAFANGLVSPPLNRLGGMSNPNSKLSSEQVREIRLAVNVRRNDLAAKYGVHPKTITKIRSGRSWKL